MTEFEKQLRHIIFQHSDIYSETDPADVVYVDMEVKEIIQLIETELIGENLPTDNEDYPDESMRWAVNHNKYEMRQKLKGE